jgi:hypothetical protein
MAVASFCYQQASSKGVRYLIGAGDEASAEDIEVIAEKQSSIAGWMMKKLKRYPFATVAFLVCLALYLFARLFGLNFTDSLRRLLDVLEGLDAGEICVVLFTLLGLLLDLAIDNRRQSQLALVRAQKLHVLKATMRTVHDLIGNFLNNLQFFRMEAEDALSTESLAAFDELVKDTASKLKILGDLEEVHEKQGATGPVIDYEEQ